MDVQHSESVGSVLQEIDSPSRSPQPPPPPTEICHNIVAPPWNISPPVSIVALGAPYSKITDFIHKCIIQT